MSADRLFEAFVTGRLIDTAMDAPADQGTLIQRMIDDELGERDHNASKRIGRRPSKTARASMRRTWEALAHRLVPKMLHEGLLSEIDGQLRAALPRDEEAYARGVIAEVFCMHSNHQRVYEAAVAVQRTQPEFGVRAVSTYLKMTRPKNKRSLSDADVVEAMMWLGLSHGLFRMWFQRLDTNERISAEDGLRMMSDDEHDEVSKVLVPMFGAADVPRHVRLQQWLLARRWKISLTESPQRLPVATGSRTRVVRGQQRMRHLRTSAFTIEEALEQLAEKAVAEAAG